MAKMKEVGLVYEQIHHDYLDTPLSGLVQKANTSNSPNKMYLSIHSNAGKGQGFEVFTSIGETRSDKYAEVICNQLQKDFPGFPLRQDTRDGDKDKEENFYVLKHTTCPAVLCELLFFDELKQAEYLNSEEGQEKLASSLFEAVKIINDMP
jgi:N-acetylmuramoyl-L-alanine amidase